MVTHSHTDRPTNFGPSERATRSPGRPPSTRRKVIWFGLVALLLGLVFGGFWAYDRMRSQMTAQFFATMKPPPTQVAAVTATAQDLPRSLGAIGTLYAVHQVMVAPEVGGRVAQIFFQAGATVQAGDPLVQLNDKPEQGDLANYRAQAKVAELNLGRSKELVSRQFTPQATVDQNQAILEQAQANIARIQAMIAQKLIRAPFGGQLGIRQVELGQFLNAGGAVVTLTDLDTLYVNFTLPEQSSSQLAVGQGVQIRVDAYPGRGFEAKLTTVEPQVAAETRSIKLQATLSNPEHLLLPGMFANIAVVLPSQPDVLTVPETAVDYSLYGDAVFVIRETGRDANGKPVLTATRTFVKTGERFASRVVILEGLKAGDQIAASGQLKLITGAPVVINDSTSLAPRATVPTN
ncbi:MAG: efflux RND transporter periplasmic adaptor subunit [Proteobacteria bacterium]|nr:efflux RND transporter periplasmic adaptor subunit [Pseudomonadota bacterium]